MSCRPYEPQQKMLLPASLQEPQGVGKVSSLLSGAVIQAAASASHRCRSHAISRLGGQLHDDACQRQVSEKTSPSSRRALTGSYRWPPTFVRPN